MIRCVLSLVCALLSISYRNETEGLAAFVAQGDAFGFFVGGCCGENIIACKKGCFVGILYFSGMVIPLSNLDVMY